VYVVSDLRSKRVCTSALAIIGIALDLSVIELTSVDPSTSQITILESELLSLPYST
jgi:hypothetical protein